MRNFCLALPATSPHVVCLLPSGRLLTLSSALPATSSVVVEWCLLAVDIMLFSNGGDMIDIATCCRAVTSLSLPSPPSARAFLFFVTFPSLNFQAKRSMNQRTKCFSYHHRFSNSFVTRQGCGKGAEAGWRTHHRCVCALHCTLALLHVAQNKRHTARCHATLLDVPCLTLLFAKYHTS